MGKKASGVSPWPGSWTALLGSPPRPSAAPSKSIWAKKRGVLPLGTRSPGLAGVPVCPRALTSCLAVELGTRNPWVRVNCILPGPVLFPSDTPEPERAGAIRSTLVRREGTPENVARAVLFFLENDFVTGACLPVNGGRTVCAAGS